MSRLENASAFCRTTDNNDSRFVTGYLYLGNSRAVKKLIFRALRSNETYQITWKTLDKCCNSVLNVITFRLRKIFFSSLLRNFELYFNRDDFQIT